MALCSRKVKRSGGVSSPKKKRFDWLGLAQQPWRLFFSVRLCSALYVQRLRWPGIPEPLGRVTLRQLEIIIEIPLRRSHWVRQNMSVLESSSPRLRWHRAELFLTRGSVQETILPTSVVKWKNPCLQGNPSTVRKIVKIILNHLNQLRLRSLSNDSFPCSTARDDPRSYVLCAQSSTGTGGAGSEFQNATGILAGRVKGLSVSSCQIHRSNRSSELLGLQNRSGQSRFDGDGSLFLSDLSSGFRALSSGSSAGAFQVSPF